VRDPRFRDVLPTAPGAHEVPLADVGDDDDVAVETEEAAQRTTHSHSRVEQTDAASTPARRRVKHDDVAIA
jgi:hypothetical protein